MASKFRLVEEDRSLMEGVFGVEAVDYFVRLASNNVLSQFTASCSDLRPEVLEGLIKIIEWFDWTYAIYWQVSTSESGKSALIWGAGHYQAGERSSNGDLNGGRGKQRKAAIHKLQACFGGSGDCGMNSGLDLVSELEIFYHASKYFVFSFDESSSHNQAFHSGKAIWISDTKCFSEHYQSRAFLAKAVQLQTVAFIPLESGVVEIGSRKSLGKDLKIINIVKDVLGSNLMQPITFPRIFGQELSLGGAKSSGDSDDHSLIQMARNILKSDYVQATVFSNDTVQDLRLGGFKSDDVSDDHNLIQMPKADCVKEKILSTDIVQDPDIGDAKSGSISTKSSSNKKYCYSLEAARQRHKERSEKSKVSIKVPAIRKKLADVPPDEYSWWKYVQKPVKGSPYPRGYYKCSTLRGCPARKEVERCLEDPTMVIVTYTGVHEHP